MKNKKISFIHILPLNCVGGAECAAKTTEYISNENFFFSLFFISRRSINYKSKFLNIIIFLRDAFYSIFKILNFSPDILIISLWKSCFIALFIKFLKPKVKIILFLHNYKSLNVIDYLFNNLIGIISFEIWADSQATLNQRIKSFYFINEKTHKKIISFILNHEKPLPINKIKTNFIFWGRLAPQKNISKAIDIFYSVYKKRKDSKFIIIGPDNGEYIKLKEKIINLNIVKNVRIFDEMNFNEIKKYAENSSFFIQSSLAEGMGMSVLESMQLGLVPIVSNVGNIKNYCIDNFNALIIDESITRKILEISENQEKYFDLRNNAIETWQSKNLYKQDIYENCLRLANKTKI